MTARVEILSLLNELLPKMINHRNNFLEIYRELIVYKLNMDDDSQRSLRAVRLLKANRHLFWDNPDETIGADRETRTEINVNICFDIRPTDVETLVDKVIIPSLE